MMSISQAYHWCLSLLHITDAPMGLAWRGAVASWSGWEYSVRACVGTAGRLEQDTFFCVRPADLLSSTLSPTKAKRPAGSRAPYPLTVSAVNASESVRMTVPQPPDEHNQFFPDTLICKDFCLDMLILMRFSGCGARCLTRDHHSTVRPDKDRGWRGTTGQLAANCLNV